MVRCFSSGGEPRAKNTTRLHGTLLAVLGLNFALGAITGTLVEFGLVQAWPGSIFAIATFGLIPLTLELVAFIGEIVLLVMFIVTLGKVRPPVSLGIIVVLCSDGCTFGRPDYHGEQLAERSMGDG